MKILYMSDLHLEFGDMPSVTAEGDVLVLAGDVTVKNNVDWINAQLQNFDNVIYILGNHEYYRGDINATPMKTLGALDPRIHFLMDASVTINDVTFHGGTLWTDCNQGNPLDYMNIGNSLNDFRLIRDQNYELRFTPQMSHMLHSYAVNYLRNNVKEGDVVITHHAPSFQSVHEKYKGDRLNYAYVSDLTELILDTKPSVMVHGHVHTSFDYTIGDTRVLCNPRGYVNTEDENPEFDPGAWFEV